MRSHIVLMRRLIAFLTVYTFLMPMLAFGISPGPVNKSLTEDQKILHVLSRLGFGARPGDVERVKKIGIDKYIEQQLNPTTVDDSVAEAKVKGLEAFNMTTAEVFAKYPNPGALLRQLEGGKAAQADKQAALRVARAALAKSGTTTLELAVAGVPMVAAYKVDALEAFVIRRLVRVPSYILANLVLGQNVVPEIVQEECTPDRLAEALIPLLGDTPERRRQVDAFATLDAVMKIGSRTPAARAAEIVLDVVAQRAARQK